MAVLTAVSNLVGANRQANAIKDSSAAAAQVQQDMYNQTRTDLTPWREAGQNALMQVSNLSGANGTEAMANSLGSFQASPGYQFRVQQGQQGIENSAAARGMLLSGSALKGVEAFRQGLAADEYGQYYARLAGLAGAGQQAANATASAGQSSALAQSGIAASRGNALSSIYGQQTQAINQGINSLGQTFGFFGGGMK